MGYQMHKQMNSWVTKRKRYTTDSIISLLLLYIYYDLFFCYRREGREVEGLIERGQSSQYKSKIVYFQSFILNSAMQIYNDYFLTTMPLNLCNCSCNLAKAE